LTADVQEVKEAYKMWVEICHPRSQNFVRVKMNLCDQFKEREGFHVLYCLVRSFSEPCLELFCLQTGR